MAGLSESVMSTGISTMLESQGRRVRISEILDNQYVELGPRDYLQVQLRWNSDLGESLNKECRLVFTEDDDQNARKISAVLYTNSQGAKDVYKKLCTAKFRNCQWKIRNFWIHFHPDKPSCLVLSGDAEDIMPLAAMDSNSFLMSPHQTTVDISCTDQDTAPLQSGVVSRNSLKRKWPLEETTQEGLKHFPMKRYDFKTVFEPLDVKVVPSKKYMDRDLKDTYAMRSNPRGIALIIHNFYYPGRKENFREGSQNDVISLTKFLKECRFKVVMETDVTSAKLPTVIADFKKEATPEMNCSVVIFLGHGIHGFAIMTDEKAVPLYDSIIYEFDESNWPIFKGKPIIFLIQKCEGIPTSKTLQELELPMMPSSQNLKLENMLICFSTSGGILACRDRYLGSHFIHVLVDVLMEHAHDTHFLRILEEVQSRLKNIDCQDPSAVHCTWTPHGFTKKLYFNPCI